MPKQPAAASGGTPRLRTANRQQVEFRASAWDDLLPADHQARIVWKYVEGLDLSRDQGGRRTPRAPGDRPSHSDDPLAVRHAAGRRQRSRTGTTLRGRPAVSVDLRRGVGQSPHALRLPRRAPGVSGPDVDAQHRPACAGRVGHARPGRSRRDEGPGQCRGRFVPPPRLPVTGTVGVSPQGAQVLPSKAVSEIFDSSRKYKIAPYFLTVRRILGTSFCNHW